MFICLEQGTDQIAVSRARVSDEAYKEGRDPRTYQEVLAVVDQLVSSTGFDNVCIDTADALESLIHRHICKTTNKAHVSEIGFQRGFDMAADMFKMIFSRLDSLKNRGVGVIVTAHSKLEMLKNPDGQDFPYKELKLHKKVSGVVVEWADNVLFARREQYALEENGKVRGVGNGARFIHTQCMPTYVAKNRYDLPEKLPLSWSAYVEAMAAHKPGNTDDLIRHANELIQQLDATDKSAAQTALNSISNVDSITLVKFVDFVRGKINVTKKEEEEQK